MSRRKAEAIQLFRELDLPSPETFGERYPHQVSGGQLQRAMAAMAMSCHPDILVLDEPTTALDVTTQIEVLASIRKLIRVHHAAGLYISHDLAVVAQVANRIMVLRHGKMVEEGEADQILHRPRMDYTRALVSIRESMAAAMGASVAGAAPVLEVSDVTASYAKLAKVVNDINLTVRKGETVAVVGESGSGKSTLARVITGLLPREAGDIRFQGTSLPPALAERSRDLLRRIQMIYQMPDVALNPRQKVGEIIGRPLSFYLGLTGARMRARIAELLQGHRPLAGIRIALSRPALGRAEAARLHCPRAGGRTRPHHLRRGDLGAGSPGGRGHPRSSRPPAALPWLCLSLHHP